MFRYLNHRFHWNNISFQIPDGFYFDCDPDAPGKNTMWLISPDRSFHISIDIVTHTKDTFQALKEEITDMMPQYISPIEPISLNGLHGHHASYRLMHPRYYEIFLNLGNGELLNIVMWSTDDDIYDKTTAAIAAFNFRLADK